MFKQSPLILDDESMDDSQDTELLAEFVSESLQGLSSIEQDSLALETEGGSDSERVNRIFRAVHSIKGTGSYMGLERLVRLSHLAETLLDQIRSGKRTTTPETTDAVLAAVDDLVGMLNTPDLGARYDSSETLNRLNAVLGVEGVPASLEPSGGVKEALPTPPTPARLADAGPASIQSCPGPSPEDFDNGLVSEFVSEGLQGLQDIEADLLSLETDGGTDRELVNRIFRAVHTIKGNGSYLKLENLVGVAHRAETLLDRVRSGTETANAVVTDAVLAAVDALMTMMQTTDLGMSFDSVATLAKLDCALNGTSNASVAQLPSDNDLAIVAKAMTGKLPIFQLHFDIEKLSQTIDVKEGAVVALSSIGKILHSSIPLEVFDKMQTGECCIYFETVLEAEVLREHFNLDSRCVVPITIDQGKNKSTKIAEPSAAIPKPQSVAPAAASAILPSKQEPTKPPAPESTGQTTNATKPKADAAREVAAVVEQSMRVPVHILHELLEWTGTMVMARNQLMNEFDFSGSVAFRTLSQAISGVHETVIETRMQTTGSLFERYRRVVRDLSRQLNKEVALHIEGGDLELDRTILESFADPLTHLIRNSLDHALETPAEREAVGKNRQGNIYLRSFIHSGEIILAVEDDGRGINPDRVCEKAVSKGVITQETANQLTEHQKVMLIFMPGFSTKDQATDVSGRGVGMDVVRNNIESVGGAIDVQNRLGQGATFSAILPLAKALVSSSLTKALIVDIQNERFAIPETAVSEIIQYDEKAKASTVQIDGEIVYQLRDKLVALVDLREALQIEPGASYAANGETKSVDSRHHSHHPKSKIEADAHHRSTNEEPCLVVLQFRKHLFGAIVDHVHGIQEIIVRGTPKLLQDCTVFSGHTVLGTGRVSLILDINGLVNKLSLKFTDKPRGNAGALKPPLEVPSSIATKTRAKQKMVIFSYSDNEYFAIPLELVAIIERISLDSIRTVGTREYCQIKNETISLMRLDSFLPITKFNESRKDCCLIRPAAISYPIGILTGPDLTVIDVNDDFESRLDDDKGVVGTFLHNDRLVMLLDLFGIFERHAPDKVRMAELQTGHAKILVAEDSLFFRKLISQYMQRDEWSIDIVNDGVEAWEKLQEDPKKYNLIISDINMPRMDGFQLAAKVRDDRRFDMLPMVALTTLSDEHFREKGLSLGFDRYVVKIDKNQVRATVSECLRIRREPKKK